MTTANTTNHARDGRATVDAYDRKAGGEERVYAASFIVPRGQTALDAAWIFLGEMGINPAAGQCQVVISGSCA